MVPQPSVILAGGLGRRMGGVVKPLIEIGGRTVLERTLDVVGRPVAVAGAAFPGLLSLPDAIPGRLGPLAGMLAAMEWAEGAVLTVPGDAPFLPPDLVDRLRAAGAPCVAASGGRAHPVVGLWPVALAPVLRGMLEGGGRRAGAFAAAVGARAVEWAVGEADPFLNLNTPGDVGRARAALAGGPGG